MLDGVNAQGNNVTFVVYHLVKANAQKEYEAWQREIAKACSSMRGYLGVNYLRPTRGDNNEDKAHLFTTVVRFGNAADMQRWMESPTRKSMIERVQPLLAEEDRTEVYSGVEYWFPPSKGLKAKPYKQFLLTLSAIYPLTLLMPWLYDKADQYLPWHPPMLLSHLLTNCLITLSMMVVMPRLTRLAASWLFPQRMPQLSKRAEKPPQ